MSGDPSKRYRRSPLLIVLWSGREIAVLHADTLQRLHVRPKMIALLARLADWSTVDDLRAAGEPVGDDDLPALHGLGLLEAEGEVTSARVSWDPLELAVHRRTARGGHFPRQATSAPPPPRDRPGDPAGMDLPPPARRLPEPLGDVLLRRRSARTYAARSLQLHELSTLLHHAARAVSMPDDPRWGARALHPFPTAGARSELELFILAVDVAGLAPGAYSYDAVGHRVHAVRPRDEHQDRMVSAVHAATDGQLNRDPAVVLVVTAVFQRTLWKYRDLGLSLIYKDVGGLFQTLYLVATALALAPCAIGSADEAENSRWLGLDPLRESQVGCFLIGPAMPETSGGGEPT